MSSEKALSKRLLSTYGRIGHFVRHEDELTPGIPDVSYALDGVCGWLELKEVGPKYFSIDRPASPFRPAQVRWMLRRWAHCPRVFALVQCAEQYVLLDPSQVLKLHENTKDAPLVFNEAVRICRNLLDLRSALNGRWR